MKSNVLRFADGILPGMVLAFGALLGMVSSEALAQSYVFNEGTLATGKGPQAVVSGDFNRDGRLDLAVANSADNTVSIFLGKPDGSFRAKVDYATGTKPTSIAMGDFNQDGRLDLAVTNAVDNTVSILLGNGNGTFQPHVDYRTGANPVSVAASDFNGDHHPDLVVANAGDNTVSILLGNGHGVFGAHTDFPTGAQPSSVSVGDVNGDGKLDLVTANTTDNTVSILLGNGNGTFQAHQDFATGVNPVSVTVGDFNGDGRLDLAVANTCFVINLCDSSSNTVSILLGNGNGTFQHHVEYPTGFGPTSVIATDFNGDGKLDLAVAEQSFFPTGAVTLLRGNGDGTFRLVNIYAAGSSPVAVASGDFNGDGKLDLAIANNLGNTVSILIGEGNLGFETRLDYPTDPTNFAESVAVISGDFNGDGIPDLAVLNAHGFLNPFTISILLGKGHGLFQKAITFPAGVFGLSLAAADFNGDGKLDLVTAGDGVFPDLGGVSVLLGNGDGTFQPPVVYPVGPLPAQVVTGDFNGDGKVDLVATSLSGGSILLGNGDGTFQPPRLSFPPPTGFLTVGDFNRDGRLDLAAGNAAPNAVSILLGNGDGTFQAPVNYPTAPSFFMRVIAADLNQDGKLDLVTTGNGGPIGTLSVLVGNGDGTFQPHVDYPLPAGVVNVIAGDFNGDGKLDLFSDGLFLLLGKGDGTFNLTENTYESFDGLLPSVTVGGLAAGDFSGNGGLDLAVGIEFPDNLGVSVFLNTPVIALFPSQLSFGKQAVGSTSAALKVQLFNPGGVPLKISSIVASGDFLQTNSCTGNLAVGAKCTVSVTFKPTATGPRTGTLTVVDNAPSSPQMVGLTGVGIAP